MSSETIRHVPGTGSDDKHQRWNFDWFNQWSAFLSPGTQNWIGFTVVKLQGEYSPYKDSAELEVWLLGFGVCITYLYDRSFNDDMESRMNDIGDPSKWRTLDEVAASLKAESAQGKRDE